MLDTSSWKVGLLGYAMRAFIIVVPRAVEAELRAIHSRYPLRLYPDTALFDQVRVQLQDPPNPAPLDRFGAAESAAIALSRSLGATLLINDHRPAEVARNLGLAVVSCPGMIVVARSQQLIAAHMVCAARHVARHHPGSSRDAGGTRGRLSDRLHCGRRSS